MSFQCMLVGVKFELYRRIVALDLVFCGGWYEVFVRLSEEGMIVL
jgi:hypothetical protein